MNNIIIFFFLLFALSLSAQQISGKVYYISKTQPTYAQGISVENEKKLDDRAKRLYEKKLILSFNQSESFYKEEVSLNNTDDAYQAGYLAASSSYSSNGIFKNTEKQVFSEGREFLGKLFLIKDSLPDYNWTLENESKKIGNYTAFKATMVKKIDSTDFRLSNAQNIQSDGNIIVTAWYTPEIPVKTGPDIYGDLPGLILEINIYRTTILCSKIILNTSNPIEIKPPKNGEEVSLDEFNKIAEEKRKEHRENFIKN